MSRHTMTALALAMGAVVGTASAGEISANVALSSDYVWRGISQTDNSIAVSGGFDWAHASGFYAGAWGSNVNFGPGDPSMELDTYVGFAGEAGDFGYDVGVIRYNYPSAGEINTNEVYLGGGYGPFSLMWSYTDDYFDSDSAWYLQAGADFALPQDFGLSLHVGKSDGDAFDGGNDYIDWRIGVSRDWAGLTFDLSYTDTDLSDAECGGNTCDARAVFSVSKSF